MNRRTLLAAVALAAVAALVVGLVWKPWSSEVPEGAAFVIGDEVVTVDELDDRNRTLRALYGIEAPSDEDELGDFRKQSAKSMAINLVLEDAFEENAIEMSEEEVDEAFSVFLERSFAGDRQAFVDALGNVGTSETTVREELRHQFRMRDLVREVVGSIEITRPELEAAFEERRDELGTPERRSVGNIVVETRAEARRVRSLLASGADLGTLARRFSIDASTRDRAGDLGTVTREEMVPAVGEAVFGTPRGGVYGPVRGPQGWNVGRVTEVVAPVPARLDRVGKELRATLELEETYDRWSAWLEDRLRDADIEYAEAYRPPAPYEITSWEDVMVSEPDAEGLR